MERIDNQRAIILLREVVAEKGADYVDPNSGDNSPGPCEYTYDDAPGCIVGHVAFKAGVPIERLHDWLGMITDEPWETQEDADLFTYDALTLLRAAQVVQDNGGTWGEALASAESDLEADSEVRE